MGKINMMYHLPFLMFLASICTIYGLNVTRISELRQKLLECYDKHAIPMFDDKPLEVTVDVLINNMVSSEREQPLMHFFLDVNLILTWHDKRLKYNLTPEEIGPLVFDHKIVDEFWSPSVRFPEAKDGNQHQLPQPNVFLSITPDGKVSYEQRLDMFSHCSMDTFYYPFDIPMCNVSISPYHNMNSITLKWINESQKEIVRNKKLRSIDFNDIEVKCGSSQKTHSTSGNYSVLFMEFSMKRYVLVYLMRDLLPVTLVVILSWSSFWIHHESSIDRIALGITTILTVVTITGVIRDNSPQAYRSIDSYMLLCNVYVLFAFLEYILVRVTEPDGRIENRGPDAEDDDNCCHSGCCCWVCLFRGYAWLFTCCCKFPVGWQCLFGKFHFKDEKDHFLDRRCKILFPASFILSIMLYFVFHRINPTSNV